MNVVFPGSVAEPVIFIEYHSLPVAATAEAVGAVFVRVPVAIAQFPVSHCASLTLYDKVNTYGSLYPVTNVDADQIGEPAQLFPRYHA